MKLLLQILALAWAALFFLVPAHAESNTVCKVQDAIRFRSPQWTETQCYRVTRAINHAAETAGQRPEILMSIAIVESDLRTDAEHWYRPWKFLPGGKYVLGELAPGVCGDLGVMGVRCCLGPDMLCSNGLVKGWKYPSVMKLENNIMLGAKILAAKPRLNDYNGGKGYAEKVYAIAGALAGVRTKSPVKRIRKLIWQILNGLGFERTT